MNPKPSIAVVAGVISNAQGQVLIAKRKNHQDQGGLWEFPGGKREEGEDSFVALKRELSEELGIQIAAAIQLLKQTHEYPTKIVNLEFFRVPQWRGEAWGAEGQEICWAEPNELSEFQFPAANRAVVEILKASKPTNHNTEDQKGYLS